MRSPEPYAARFVALVRRAAELQADDANEARTRLEVIDGILDDVLGWAKADFSPEEATDVGQFTDYLLRSHKNPLLVVEAKRVGRTFTLPVNYRRRQYKVSFLVQNCGPELKEAMTQAAAYCNQRGAPYAAVTNGWQWIVFRGLGTDHRGWGAFPAVVFNGIDDLSQNYLEFWSLLTKHRVLGGALAERLNVEPVPPPEYARRPNSELSSRGSLRMSSDRETTESDLFFDHYFDDIVGRDDGEMLRQCYVDDVEIREYDRELRSLLTDQWSALSDHLGADELTEERLRDVIADPKPGTNASVVLLVGRVGAGKSTFIHRFFGQMENPEDGERHARFVVDLINDAQAATTPRDDERERISKRILEAVSNRYSRKSGFGPEFDPYADATLRTIFGSEVRRVKDGPLCRVYERDKERFERDVGAALTERARDAAELLPAFVNYIAGRTKRPFCLVFDNLDRATDAYQRFIYAFAHDLAQRVRGVIVLSLRESTYWKARHQGFLDTRIADVVLQLSPPNLKSVVSRRLKYLDSHVATPKLAQQSARRRLSKWAGHGEFLRELLLREDESGRKLLTCLANRSVRRAFFLLREYGKSTHAWKRDMVEAADTHLLAALMLGKFRVYEPEAPIYNLFRVSERVRGSHFLAALILCYLERVKDGNAQMSDAVPVTNVLGDFEAWGFARQLVVNALSQLSSGLLVETDGRFIGTPVEGEPQVDADAPALDEADRVRLSPAGVFYLRDMLPNATYRALCGGDSFWYGQARYDAFMPEYESAIALADSTNSSAAMLMASKAPQTWEEYLTDEWRREERLLAPSAAVGWRVNVLDGVRLPAAAAPQGLGAARKPSRATPQESLPFAGELSADERLARSAVTMPAILEKTSIDGDVFLARVVWVLELGRRAGLSSQTAAEIARLCLAHGKVHAQDTNTARFFRACRTAGRHEEFWHEEGVGGRRKYRLSETGLCKFAKAFPSATPTD